MSNHSKCDVPVSGTMSDLQSLRTLVCQYDRTSGLINVMDQLLNSIVHIVVAGGQSAGKSTLLNRLYGLNLPVDAGRCTMCPIEMRIGPNYTEERVYVLHKGVRHVMANLSTAHDTVADYVRSKCGGQATLNMLIVREMPNNKYNVVITDMPGVYSDPSGDALFHAMRDKYFSRPNTILFYVARGDVDPATDLTRRYISNLHYVPVLTHTDTWDVDRSKLAYLAEHARLSAGDRIALVNNHNDEVALLQRINPACGKLMVCGHEDLRAYIATLLEETTRANFPAIRAAIDATINAIDVRFAHIGPDTPNMDVMRSALRTELLTRVGTAFSAGSDLAVATNASRRHLTGTLLLSVARRHIPTVEQLAVDLEKGTRSSLPGSEGWSDVVRVTNRKILSDIRVSVLDPYITAHIGCVQSEVEKLFEPVHHPATKVVQGVISALIAPIVDEHKTALINDSTKMVTDIMNCPYSVDRLFTHQWARAAIEQPVLAAIAYFVNATNKAEAVTAASRDPHHVLDHVVRHMPDSMYKINATMARQHLTCFWESKCGEIETRMREKLMTFELAVQLGTERMVRDHHCDDLAEPAETAHERMVLTDIKVMCDKIKRQL